MKRTIFTIILLNLAYLINAQEKTLKELIAEGNKTYVEFIDVKKNIPEAQNAINTALKGEEWNCNICFDMCSGNSKMKTKA